MMQAARRHAAGAALLMTLGSGAVRASTTPGRAIVLDAFADPFSLGHFGALFEAEPLASPSGSATPLSSSAVFYQPSDLALRLDGSIIVVDREADPSGLGPDANGDHGAGAVLLGDAATQALSILADGSDYPAGLPPATSSIFVEPMGVAVLPDGRMLVVDMDADPSQLGVDSAGFAGHGALFEVSPSGSVTLLSDGTLSDDGPPPAGATSWFEDPGAVAVASDGSVHLLDRFGDPLAIGGRGAVYAVDIATGRIRLEAVSASFAGPAFIAEWRPGMLLVSDQLARPLPAPARGALFSVDLSQADPTLATALVVADPRFRGPSGLGSARDGSVFVADPFSDPLALGRIGGVFRLRPDGALSVASSAPEYLAPSSVRVVAPVASPPAVLSIDPAFAELGQALTVRVDGAGFTGPAELRLGPGVTVTALRTLSSSAAEADLAVDMAAPIGVRDVAFVNEDLQPGVLAGGFEVRARTQPIVLAIDPPAAIQGTSTAVTVTGDRLAAGAVLDLGAGVTVTNVVVPDAFTLTAEIALDPGAAIGQRDVVVTNPDATTGRLIAGFEVLAPAPPLPTAVTPSQLAPDQDQDVVVAGSGFVAGCVFDLGSDIEEGPALVTSPFSASLRVHVRAEAPAGPRDVAATNPDLRTGVLPAGIDVAGLALRILAARIEDAAGNRNGALDPGETVALDIGAFNAGAAAATGLVLRISDAAPGTGLTIVRGAVVFPDIAAGVSMRRAAAPFLEIHVDPAAACGDPVPLDVELVQGAQVVARRRMTLGIGRIAGWGRKPSLDGDVAGGRRGDALAMADLDGDGVADLLVGAPRESPAGLFAAGRVIAVAGRGDDVLWRLDGDEIDGRLGASLCAVGDIDGDGAEDVLVGSPGAGLGAGRLLLVSGIDGSVIDDRPGDPGDGLGGSLAWLGDRNLDGQPEVIAGAPRAGADRGAALILGLPALEEQERLVGTSPSERLGASVAGGADLDGDGRMDALVGAPAGSAGGRAVAWRSGGLPTDMAIAAPGDRLGSAVAMGADLDDDGVVDILVGAPGSAAGDAGRVEALSGRNLAPLRTLPGLQAGAEAGMAVAFGPDQDGDGIAEIVMGSPGIGGDDGLVEMRSGADGRFLGFEAGALGEAGRFGERLVAGRDASGDAFADMMAGAPEHGAVVPRSGRGMALKALVACSIVTPCTPDALEPNAPGAPRAMPVGRVDDLSICQGDVDAFLLAPAPSRRVAVIVSFTHAVGDLDATLHDAASGALIESSLSLDDDEELGPVGPGGPYELRVFGYDGARNAYSLIVVDPDTCPVLTPVRDVRATKAGGRVVLTWQPSPDPCHAPPPAQGYRVWKAPSPAPVGPPGPFPAGTAFVDVSSSDQDGDLGDERFIDDLGGPDGYYLVTDRGRSGEDGPATP